MTVTRTELLDCVESAFTAGTVGRAELIQVAVESDARNEVLLVLRDLPDSRFSGPRDLWAKLPEMPISA